MGNTSKDSTNADDGAERFRVRLWFGEHVVTDVTGGRRLAEKYAAAMDQRFAGLRITIDPAESPPTASPAPRPQPSARVTAIGPWSGRDIPADPRWWPFTVK